MEKIQRGDVFYVDLDPTKGAEMKKKRRAVVVSRDSINENADVVVICPITTDTSQGASPIHILVNPSEDDNAGCGLDKESVVHCGQVRAVSKGRFGEKAGTFSRYRMAQVSKGIKIALDLP